MNARLVQIINEYGRSTNNFAVDAGINRTQIFRWINGSVEPSLDGLIRIHKLCPHVNLHWLITGENK